MPLPITPSLIGRRRVIAGAAFAIAAGQPDLQAQPAVGIATPPQTRGPFYPVDWSGDVDADLVRVQGAAAAARGVVTHLRGRILNAAGQPVPGALVEIWQCDANGVYRHPNDRAAPRDSGFQGRGRAVAQPDGGYAFRTIQPVAYPGRTPHIHVLVAAPGQGAPLVTQLYLADHPLNDADGLFRQLRDPLAREAVLLRPQSADRIEEGALLALRDIVLG